MNELLIKNTNFPASNAIKEVTLDAASQETRVVENTSSKKCSPSQQPERNEVKENRWKLAFRQLMFMKDMNNKFNNRTKNEIELRQQHITVRGQIISVQSIDVFTSIFVLCSLLL
jgi:hypothetical protein